MTKLSIIIPIYNVEKYIRKTLESIFSQSYPTDSLEVIVVNDGTPDNSMSIVSEYALKYDNLRVIEQENQGLSGARNTGLTAAQGEYVWFVDSDDWIEDGGIEKVLALLNDDADVFMFKIREYDEEGNVLLTRSFHDDKKVEVVSGTDIIFYEKKYEINLTPMQQYIIKRKFIEVNGLVFMCGIYHEDKEYAPKMLIAANIVKIVPFVSYCYLRRNSGSITTNMTLQRKRSLSKITIFRSLLHVYETIVDVKKKKAIRYCLARMAAFLWNGMSMDEIKEFGKEYGLWDLLPSMKKSVLCNLFYDKKLLHLFRQLVFLSSPCLLKKMHKNL